ncbi:hypothetical protein [Paenibacillus azoreducens]|uniref:Uncharacterized protein n=1 Tax=Paenibacillus azoreducens TaxID=116718 RepID=A0A920CTB5_9BACL|nr:hypothetical protein [Paenibacillus azoreducens]GIO48283.1 hypothetical protein J34TS1_30480 [Paenibacillus azoreducens]
MKLVSEHKNLLDEGSTFRHNDEHLRMRVVDGERFLTDTKLLPDLVSGINISDGSNI